MRKTFVLFLLLAAARMLPAQVYSDPRQLYGVYYIYDFHPYESVRAPKGYAPAGISHYSRHGARFQDSEAAYTRVLDPLLEAREKGALTPLGEALCRQTAALYAVCKDHHSELTALGWEQQRRNAAFLKEAYPSLFHRDAEITANSSFSQRCMMSMTAFCVGLQEVAPRVRVYAQTSRTLLDETNPGDKANIHYVAPEPAVSPWGYDYKGLLDTLVSRERADSILLRIFSDKEAIRSLIPSSRDYCSALYNMTAGAGCSPEAGPLPDVFTEDELRLFYQAINHGFYVWAVQGRETFKPILRSMARDADEDLKAGHPVVRLRFGHDINLLAVMHMLQVGTLGVVPESLAGLQETWNCFMTPMCAHFELVFFRHRKDAQVLVLPYLNGDIVPLAGLEPVGDVFYRWEEVRERMLNPV